MVRRLTGVLLIQSEVRGELKKFSLPRFQSKSSFVEVAFILKGCMWGAFATLQIKLLSLIVFCSRTRHRDFALSLFSQPDSSSSTAE